MWVTRSRFPSATNSSSAGATSANQALLDVVDRAATEAGWDVESTVGPAAIPLTLAKSAEQIRVGDRVLCMGIGSGLNTSFTEIVW